MLKLVFVSNYYNHHQASLSRAMYEQTDHRFAFIETEPMSEERIAMGWGEKEKPSYVFSAYESKDQWQKCQKVINEAEVVIWGSCPFSMIRPRLRKKKLTFAYSERIFKNGFHGMNFWGRAVKYIFRLALYQKNHYLLCASAYAAGDYARIGLFRGRAFKWGYFPETRDYNIDELFAQKRKNEKSIILWVARFIGWKHPEVPVLLAEKLKQEGCTFDLKLIGNGELSNKIASMIREKKLEDCVHMLGAMSPDEVRKHMEQANIFLFTSDRNEGWGAVLNEAMNSGCAVVASHAIGSVPYLIKNGNNGYIYENEGQLHSLVIDLIKNPDRTTKFGTEALQSILTQWNGKNATERLCELCEKIRQHERAMFTSGVCAPCYLIQENNM